MLSNYKVKTDTMILLCDDMSAINIAKNHVQHSKIKHIDIRRHFIQELVEQGIIKIEYVITKQQLADLFIKPLGH